MLIKQCSLQKKNIEIKAVDDRLNDLLQILEDKGEIIFMEKEEIKWKWKSTIIDFSKISDELADYGNYITKKYMVFHYLGTPDNKIHEWYNGGYSCEYNSALKYAKQLGLVEDYIDYESSIYDLEIQLKKQQEINQKAIEYINKFKDSPEYIDAYDITYWQEEVLAILENKEETDTNVGEV